MFWRKPRIRFVTQHGVYAEAFQKLSRSLWLIFGGWVAITVGGIPVIVMSIAQQRKAPIPGGAWIMTAGGILMIAGVIANLAGKYKCHDLHQSLQLGWRLPGHHWLAGSLWCDIANFLLKWIARGLAMKWIKLLALPLAIASMVLFLLFLRKTADIIDRPVLKRLADVLLAAMSMAIVLGGGTIGLFAAKIHNPFLLVTGLASVVLFAAAAACYMALLFLMARATGEFANHLVADEWLNADDYESPGVEQEPA